MSEIIKNEDVNPAAEEVAIENVTTEVTPGELEDVNGAGGKLTVSVSYVHEF